MNENIANQADDKAVIKDKTAYNKPIESVPKPDPNVGVDFTVLNGRLSGTTEYFYKKTSINSSSTS